MVKALVSEYDCGMRLAEPYTSKLLKEGVTFGTAIDELLPKLDKKHDKQCKHPEAHGLKGKGDPIPDDDEEGMPDANLAIPDLPEVADEPEDTNDDEEKK